MTGRTHVIWRLLPSLSFPLVILAIGVYVFASSFSHKFITAAFAGAFAGVLIVLSAALLVREIYRGVAKLTLRPENGPTETDQQTPSLIGPLAWCAGFFVGVLLIGLMPAIALWVFVFLWVHKASRVLTFVAPVLLWVILKIGFEYGLETSFFEGILFGGRLPVFW